LSHSIVKSGAVPVTVQLKPLTIAKFVLIDPNGILSDLAANTVTL